MGMSTHVIGVKAPDEKFRMMEKVYQLCLELDIDMPAEVSDFFEGDEPNEMGVEVEIPFEESEDGCIYTVNVKKIPKDVTHIQFKNSW